MNRAPAGLFALMLSCSMLTGASDPPPEDGGMFSAEAAAMAAEVDRRFEAIAAELEGVGRHEWAGIYYEGDGLGTNISVALAPKAGVAASNAGPKSSTQSRSRSLTPRSC